MLLFGILGLASYFEIFFNYSYSTVTQDFVNYDSDYKAINVFI